VSASTSVISELALSHSTAMRVWLGWGEEAVENALYSGSPRAETDERSAASFSNETDFSGRKGCQPSSPRTGVSAQQFKLDACGLVADGLGP